MLETAVPPINLSLSILLYHGLDRFHNRLFMPLDQNLRQLLQDFRHSGADISAVAANIFKHRDGRPKRDAADEGRKSFHRP